VPVGDGGRGGPIVGGLVLPGEAAVAGVEGVEVIAAEAPAQEDAAVDDRRRRQAAPAGDRDPPAPEPPVRAGER
jgi:hypothetical protein